MCNWRKSLKLFGQTSEIANIIINQDSSTRFLFVTFTVKNCDADKLSQTIDMMNMGFKRLTDKSKGVKITENLKIICSVICEQLKLHTISKKIHITLTYIAYLPLRQDILRVMAI